MENDNESRVESDTVLHDGFSSSYVQELIIDSDLMISNEEMHLFPTIAKNNSHKNEVVDRTPVLITEVEFENRNSSPIVQNQNNMLGSLIEEVDEISQISETASPVMSTNRIVNDENEETIDRNMSEDNHLSNDEEQSLFLKEELWDTDLEEDFDTSKDRSSTSAYIDHCAKLEVVPVKYYLQNMHKPTLLIRHHGLGPVGTKALAKSLESNISVDNLDLSGNWIYHVGAVAIGRMLEENNFITKLVLCDNLIGDQGLIGICKGMQVNRGLKHLDLSGNQLTDHGCSELAELITKSKYLVELCLSRNNINSTGARLLSSAIASNDILEHLDLSWNKIRGDGAVEIAKGLKENIRIKNCNLSYNGFGKDGGRGLATAIRDNSALKILNIEANRFDGEIAILIGKSLTTNDTLQELRIGYNAINTNGILSLLSSVNSFESSQLTSLYLTDMPVDYEITKVIENIQLKRPEFYCVHGLVLAVGNTPEDIKKRALNLKHPILLLKNHIVIKDKRLIDILMRIDVEKKNCVTIQQFSEALQELGVPFSHSQVNEIKERLDKLRNGTIYYGDFIPNSPENVPEEKAEM